MILDTIETGEETTMLNILIALIVGMVMGWSFHAFFIELSPPKFLQPDFNLSKPYQKEVNSSVQAKEKPFVIETLQASSQVEKAEPLSYAQKIQSLLLEIETAPADKLETLHQKLRRTSQHYINTFNTQTSDELLIAFLEAQIELDVETGFYIYQLALAHFKAERYDEALTLLKEIEYDYEYEEKVKSLIQRIEEKRSKEKEYTHQFPLTKVGEHFTLDVTINNIKYTLLLDTGASLTMVNDMKLPILPTIRENVTLNTAGGEITATIKEAESFKVDSLELRDFQIVSASFQSEQYDGLLGMNFFKKFQFKIDQNNALLLLSPKQEMP